VSSNTDKQGTTESEDLDEVESGDRDLSDQDIDEVAGGGGCLKPLGTSGCTGH